jgi:DNA-binding CsgD family transcriptional regulator
MTALAAIVGEVGRADMAQSMLQHIDPFVRVASLATYQVWPDRPPVMHLAASRGVPDVTASCFAAYRDLGLYARDRSFDAVKDGAAGGHACMLRMNANQAPNADHRDVIYVRHGMVERVSLARRESDGSVLALNLYKHVHQHPFDDAELGHCARLGKVLLALASRHVELRHGRCADRRSALKLRCPELTEREMDVLARLLDGMTYHGIAADMALSLSTVKTYRERAFERMGIHSRHQLVAALAAP